ncbi:hypothetical protein Ancab_009229 [Ancistrocladus abbreviatus]
MSYELETLNLAGSGFNGHIPHWLGEFRDLKYLNLDVNRFYGQIPASLGQLSSLRELYTSDNSLNEAIPSLLGILFNLRRLDVSENSLEGVLSEAHFANLSCLKELTVSKNLLRLKVRPDWVPTFRLKTIELASCRVGTEFPPWIWMQKKVDRLDLSNASISGTLPKWLGSMKLSYFNLSHNQINGTIPLYFPSSQNHIDLSNNQLSGPLSSKIDLQNNRISGVIPDCWSSYQNLGVIYLSSNKLSGVIPRSIGQLSAPQWLHLNNNTLQGNHPSSLSTCRTLTDLDLAENNFSGIVSAWIGEDLLSLQILRLRSNMLSRHIPSQLCSLYTLQILDLANPADVQWSNEDVTEVMKGESIEHTEIVMFVANMDLSNNNLAGPIPQKLMDLTGMLGSNLSHNHVTGSIPQDIGKLMSSESLDLSYNELSGIIPQTMSALTSLSHLNLSYNRLSAEIPTGHQLQILDDLPSIYIGNLGLCADPLPKKCRPVEPTVPTITEEEEEGKVLQKMRFDAVLVQGFVTGFWRVLGAIFSRRSWRHSYLQLVEEVADWIFVAVAVRRID